MEHEQRNASTPPELSEHSKEGFESPQMAADRLQEKQMEVELTKLHIQELQKRIELSNLKQKLKGLNYDNENYDEHNGMEAATHTNTHNSELPRREIQRFNGDPKFYWSFIKEFQATVERKTKDNQARLTYLIQFCDGKARAAIQHCTILDEDEGYAMARHILHKRFGQNHMVARMHIDEIIDGPFLADDDSEALMHLAQQMQVCEATLKQLNYDSDLNSSRTIDAIVRRLPSRLRFKWAKVAATSSTRNGEPLFENLVTFIEEHADIACTRYGELAIAMKGQTQASNKPVNRRLSATGLSKNVHLIRGNDQPPGSSYFRPRCSVCEGAHYTDQCTLFGDKTMEERREIVRTKKLCNLCLKPNHMAKDCKSARSCTVEGCGRRHHRLLHFEFKDTNSGEPSAINNHHTTGLASYTQFNPLKIPQIALAVVPVIVCCGDRRVQTCAFLDNGSDSSLISESLMNKLGVKGSRREITLATLNKQTTFDSVEISFDVQSIYTSSSVHVSRAWSVKTLPQLRRVVPTVEELRSWPHLKEIPFTSCEDQEVGLLIGCDVPEAHWTIEQRTGQPDEPYAVRTMLGWTLLGPVGQRTSSRLAINSLQLDDIHRCLIRLYENEFKDSNPAKEKEMSVEDRLALVKMEESISLRNGHYEIALPWRIEPVNFPNNRSAALQRLLMLRKRFLKSDELLKKYTQVMNEYIDRGYAEKACDRQGTLCKWYLPHHPVFHPAKPDKLRIVFDCAARYAEHSLNDQLLSGPDFTNSLIGVLLRFRREPIAVIADIEAMFHQVRVPEKDRDALRFLWWPDGDLHNPPREFRMCVHLFGATSSSSCASFALKQAIANSKGNYDPEVVAEAERCFYVDDCLFSVSDTNKACHFIKQLKGLLLLGGFILTKWASNDDTVVETVMENERANSVIQLDLETPRIQRTLGMLWDVKADAYKFQVIEMTKPFTRRNLLSFISSIYDPLGYVAPITLTARILLQRLCKLRLSWDDIVPNDELCFWEKWFNTLPHIETLSIPRSINPCNFQQCINIQLHVFCDASEAGYGAVAYALFQSQLKTRHCSILISKARVAPILAISIPRLELAAAVVAVNLARQVYSEMNLPLQSTTFWTDSMIVLQSICNSTKRFPTFFANRLAIIHEASRPEQWRHTDTKKNPTDSLSRGAFASTSRKLQRWFDGPSFLYDEADGWPELVQMRDGTTENAHSLCNATCTIPRQTESPFYLMFMYVSSWVKLQRLIAWLLRFKRYIANKGSTDSKHQAQYIADVWRKWTKYYLPTLQMTNKWHAIKHNIKKGDLVLLLDINTRRGLWPKAIVEDVRENADGLVRDALVRTTKGVVWRDIRQLCVLEGDLISTNPDNED